MTEDTSSSKVEDDGNTFEIIDVDMDDGDIGKKKKPDDLASAFMGFFTTINYKMLLFLFIIFIFITSDIFVDKILSRINGTVEHTNITTNKGTFIQGLFLVLFYIIMDMLIKLGVI